MNSGEDTETYDAAKRLFEAGRHREAFNLYVSLAERGNVECQRFVGWMLLGSVRGVEKDYEQAGKWLSLAAASGDGGALYLLGVTKHRSGDYGEALVNYEKAAESGYSSGYYQLARMYYSGIGVQKDRKRAYELFEEAARRGHVFARREIAVMLMKGHKGLIRIPIGLATYLTNILSGTRTVVKDPYDEKTFE